MDDPNSMQNNMIQQQQMMQKGGNMQNQQMIGQQYYSPRLQGSGVGTANPHQTLSPRTNNMPTLNSNRVKNSRQLPRIPTLSMQGQARQGMP